LYFDVLRLSGYDEHGLPKIDKLEFVLGMKNYNLLPDELSNLIERLLLIHDLNYTHLLEKLKRNG